MSDLKILGDWGTSSCRLYLCDNNTVLENTDAIGIKFTNDVAATYAEAVKPWVDAHGPLPAFICGMVGSNIGWIDAGYLDCPTSLLDLKGGMVELDTQSGCVTIAPGVRTEIGLSQTPDVMRGEEVQIFGWSDTHGVDGNLCLPGTHTKWARLRDGRLENFVTSVNGEMFDVISNHTVLVGKAPTPPACIGNEFRHGVEVGASTAPLMQSLMSVRTYQITGEYDVLQAKSYLLGVLIGSDVSSSLEYFDNAPIDVVGGAGPASFYAEAICLLGGKARVHGGQETVLIGLRRLSQ